MLSLENIYLRRALYRANELLEAGDGNAARAEMSRFVRRFRRSVAGWSSLLSVVARSGGTLEDRLDVLRAAVEAIPYDARLTMQVVDELLHSARLIGEFAYVAEARRVVERFEEVLGVSTDSLLMQADVARMSGDVQAARAALARAEEALRDHPDARASLRLGCGLALLAGQERRGVELATAAARRIGDPHALVFVAAICEHSDPKSAGTLFEHACAGAAERGVSRERLEAALSAGREEIRLEHDFISSLPTRRST